MNGVLADTSVWIAYFKGRQEDRHISDALDYLLSGDEAVVNDVMRMTMKKLTQGATRLAAAFSNEGGA